jgi:excisionase family DNA binding protein
MAPTGRIRIEEIAKRLEISRAAVYKMLEDGQIPSIRVGKRWLVTHYVFEQWERTCGMKPSDVA